MTTDASPQAVEAQLKAHALSDAAAAAGQAPCIHHTQPWRWRLTGDQLDLYLDHGRDLEVTDPYSRLAVLSCGAALHHALVSLAADGWHSMVARLPNRAHPDHLAQLRVANQIPVELDAVRHRQSIGLRHTNRRPNLSTMIDGDTLRSITAAVQSTGTRLHLLRPAQVFELAAAADRAQRTASGQAAWQAERGYWAAGDRPLGGSVDDAVGPRDAQQATGPGRYFGHHGDLLISEAHDRAAVFAILHGPEDTTLSWLRAGEAFSAAWLTATELAISVLPLSATIEVATTRENVRRLLPGLGYPYLILRLGTLDSNDTAGRHTRHPPPTEPSNGPDQRRRRSA